MSSPTAPSFVKKEIDVLEVVRDVAKQSECKEGPPERTTR